MIKVHGFLDGKKVISWLMHNIPRTGDTVRLDGDRYAKVTEVIWCDDEDDTGQRVNLRMESERATQAAMQGGA